MCRGSAPSTRSAAASCSRSKYSEVRPRPVQGPRLQHAFRRPLSGDVCLPCPVAGSQRQHGQHGARARRDAGRGDHLGPDQGPEPRRPQQGACIDAAPASRRDPHAWPRGGSGAPRRRDGGLRPLEEVGFCGLWIEPPLHYASRAYSLSFQEVIRSDPRVTSPTNLPRRARRSRPRPRRPRPRLTFQGL